MGSAALFLLPPHIKQPHPPSSSSSSSFLLVSRRPRRSSSRSIVPVARLFGPAIFEASKLKVLFLGVDEEKHPGKLPRTYTLTHSDITSKLTLAVGNYDCLEYIYSCRDGTTGCRGTRWWRSGRRCRGGCRSTSTAISAADTSCSTSSPAFATTSSPRSSRWC
ncbi:protein STAY-GREEN, chloroplastic-like [Iris pallida]|uniref:Protein STAY-GREEN, chloroplastic-like n=1 Tax=Iris pallida TaxID=29817 RepID=A0AAX6EUA6_IRIPA|nr:protein STAY-GREEN, chloroplastic-like [Iris pallida]